MTNALNLMLLFSLKQSLKSDDLNKFLQLKQTEWVNMQDLLHNIVFIKGSTDVIC